MTEIIVIAFALLLGMTWIGLVVGFLGYGIEHWDEHPRRAVKAWVVSALLFVFVLAWGISSSQQGSHPNALCITGHQVWSRGARGSISKLWVCDQWESN